MYIYVLNHVYIFYLIYFIQCIISPPPHITNTTTTTTTTTGNSTAGEGSRRDGDQDREQHLRVPDQDREGPYGAAGGPGQHAEGAEEEVYPRHYSRCRPSHHRPRYRLLRM